MGGGSTLTFSVILLVILFSTPPAATSYGSLPYTVCIWGNGTYVEGDNYSVSLGHVLDELVQKTGQKDGFSSASWGPQANTSTGIAMCREDVLSHECTECLTDARSDLTRNCETRAAIVWRDRCYLKYADYNFLGKSELSPYYIAMNKTNMVVDPKGFNAAVIRLMGTLINMAGASTRLFAKGQVRMKEHKVTIYGRVQCSRDLSKDECTSNCLSHLVYDDFHGFTNTTRSVGGVVLTGSCTARYNTYNFFETRGKMA